MTKEQSKENIKRLVDQFDKEVDLLKKSDFKSEAQVEEQYIKPLFQNLNWNIHNIDLASGREEFIVQYKHKLKITFDQGDENLKRPDYLLRFFDKKINKMSSLFFMEAKHPKYKLSEDIRWIRQAYKYSHSTLSRAELPENRVRLSLLTDFEEFRLFDCLDPEPLKQNSLDLFNKQVIKKFDWQYPSYVDKFDDLWEYFEKNNVTNGSLDFLRLSDEDLIKNRKAVDLRFLEDLEEWRRKLASSMYYHDRNTTTEIMTAASQLILNRFIFIKMLSDKNIEDDYLSLLIDKVKQNKSEVISLYELCQDVFTRLDDTYNGSIFQKRDELDIVKVSNKVLKDILDSLRPDKSLYTFDAMPTEILGTVYEEFLGKTIVLKNNSVTDEFKPEVNKAGGVFYTPKYIVQKLVNDTLGKLLDKCKTPEDVAKIKILDPACGSGSFLIGAYDLLLKWHLSYYKNECKKLIEQAKEPITTKNKKFIEIINNDRENKNFDLRLRVDLKKEILKNNIFGVDLDSQAVEITKFSLSIKALEDVNKDDITKDVSLFESRKEKILPELNNNILCNNSLIGKDIILTTEEKFKIKPMDWNKSFKDIFNDEKNDDEKGFDCIIGNPPYIEIQKLQSIYPKECLYIKEKYETAKENNIDIYVVFIQKGLELLKKGGLLGYICPNRFFTSDYGTRLRNYLYNYNIFELINFRHYLVFNNADTYTTLLFIENDKQQESINYLEYDGIYKTNHQLSESLLNQRIEDNIKSDKLNPNFKDENNWFLMTNKENDLFKRLIKSNKPFSEIYKEFFVGIQTSKDEIYILKLVEKKETASIFYSKYLQKEVELENNIMLHLISDPDIKNYWINTSDYFYVIFPYLLNGTILEPKKIELDFPRTWQYLNQVKKELREREKGKFDNKYWYCFGRNQNIDKQKYIKLLVPHVISQMRCAYDINGDYAIKNVGVNGIILKDNIKESPFYIMAILNSPISTFIISKVSIFLSGGFYASNKQFACQIPIKQIDFNDSKENDLYDSIVKKSQEVMDLNYQLLNEKLKSRKDIIISDITDKTDEINEYLFKLYNLSSEEIRTIKDV
ncbi:MAG: N-6 DNA methylase [Spirochaetes bacterium]|nr:N-6 DNA methylase [Spirochaetota bacterium]